jgi:hypothetical protein
VSPMSCLTHGRRPREDVARLSDTPHAGDIWSRRKGSESRAARAVTLHLMVTTFVFSYYYVVIKLCSCLAPSWSPLPTRPASFVAPTPSGNPHSISLTGRQVC